MYACLFLNLDNQNTVWNLLYNLFCSYLNAMEWMIFSCHSWLLLTFIGTIFICHFRLKRKYLLDMNNAMHLPYETHYIKLSFYRTRVRSLFTLVSNWLTDSCLVNLIDVTLASEDANSKLVNVVTVADEDRVGNNLLRISKLRFCQKTKLLFRLWAQGLVKILKL